MLRSFSEKNICKKIGKNKDTQRLTPFPNSYLVLVRVVELSPLSCVNLDSIILLWIVFLVRQIISLCLLKSSSKIWVFTSVPFFHKVGEEPINRINWPPMLPSLPNQLINSISPAAGQISGLHPTADQIFGLHPTAGQISNVKAILGTSETKSQLLFDEGKPPKKRPFKGTLSLNLLKSTYSVP